MSHRMVALLCCVLAFVMSASSLCAAEKRKNAATVDFVVTDPSGAPIAGAKINVREIHQDKDPQEFSTGEDGMTSFHLPFGEYRLTVTAVGFRKLLKNIRVPDSQRQYIVAVLEIGTYSGPAVEPADIQIQEEPEAAQKD